MNVHRKPDKAPRRIRVLIVTSQDSGAGAPRAIHRVYESLRDYQHDALSVSMRVVHKHLEDNGIIGGKPARNRLERIDYFVRTRLRKRFLKRTFVTSNTVLHSQALYDSGLGRELNKFKADIILLGWLGSATLSIREIGKLKTPVVWRLSDMWVFSGAEHYTDTKRYKAGYSRKSRPVTESGPDINRATYLRKKRHWRRRQHLVPLTKWLSAEATESTLTRHWPQTVIPVPLCPERWYPEDRVAARRHLGLPSDSLIVMFGAGAGTQRSYKGADLLFEALPWLAELWTRSSVATPMQLVIFGDDPEQPMPEGFPTVYLGRLDDDGLRSAYSAADVFVVPSRLEALGQVGAEAQMCATPVVAFRDTGLRDVVDDSVTGKLVDRFSPEALAQAMWWVLEDEPRRQEMGKAARERGLSIWHPRIVSAQYREVFESILSCTKG